MIKEHRINLYYLINETGRILQTFKFVNDAVERMVELEKRYGQRYQIVHADLLYFGHQYI